MKFSELAKYLQELEETSSRNRITEILAEVFKKAKAEEIDKICYLLLGRIAPQYEGIEFNFAEKMMLRAISQAYEVTAQDVLREYKNKGDLGDVAQQAASEKRPPAGRAGKTQNAKPSVGEVYERLYKVATEGGEGSQERKLEAVAELLKGVDPLSAKYIARIPVGRLRLGFSDITMLDALSLMEVGDKSKRKEIEAAYNVTADIGKIAARVKKVGTRGLERINAEPGTPIRPSLAERLPSAEKIIEKVGPQVAVEPKFDGFRLQLHLISKGGEKRVMLFSRNHENVTSMFPEVAQAVKRLPFKSAIFDGEAIGYNPKTKKFLPFQETVQRKRKYGIEEKAREMPLKVFIFDALYLNGKSLMHEPFVKRRRILEDTLKTRGDTIAVTQQKVVSDPKTLRLLFNTYFGEGLEGIVAKKLDMAYQAGARGYHWVKFKKYTGIGKGPSASSGLRLADTIDCVLMGAYRGRGKRVGFGYGGFLLGVPGSGGRYYSLSNLGTGLTDEQFREMKKTVNRIKVSKMPGEYVVDKTIEPDVWVKPVVVLEILADEITLSPRHTAGRGDIGRARPQRQSASAGGRGYSLRFPRLIRVRDDKNPEQATSVKEVEKLYKMSR